MPQKATDLFKLVHLCDVYM